MATLLTLDQVRSLTSSQASRLFLREQVELMSDPVGRAAAIAAANRHANRAILRPLKDLGLVITVRPWLRGESGVVARKETNLITPAGVELVQAHHDEVGRGTMARPAPDPAEIDGSDRVHDELIVDAYVAFRRAAESSGRIFWGWRDDRDLRQVAQERATTMRAVVADALFVISQRAAGTLHHRVCLVELDRGTETVVSPGNRSRNWASKVERYEAYLAGYWHRDPLLTGFDQPPVLLGVTLGPRRLPNLVAATADRMERATWRLTLHQHLVSGPRAALDEPIWTDPTTGEIADLATLLGPS